MYVAMYAFIDDFIIFHLFMDFNWSMYFNVNIQMFIPF
jgi:hypothetical protein